MLAALLLFAHLFAIDTWLNFERNTLDSRLGRQRLEKQLDWELLLIICLESACKRFILMK